jgi:hypothetical protein
MHESAIDEALGAFPTLGPLTYMELTPTQVRAALRGPYPWSRTWYHLTPRETLPIILRQGLVPACWRGGDTCCVFGYDSLLEADLQRSVAVEVHSSAPETDLKAWWVPFRLIRGFWDSSGFVPIHAARRALAIDEVTLPDVPGGCMCNLSELCDEQISAWRRTWRSPR